MDNKKTFCEECRREVLYTEIEEHMSAELKDKNYNYYGKKATCNECNSELFISEINDYNLKQLYDEFRKQNNVIALDKILEIPKRYNIGKRPLSILLGWGEQTFSRYCDGDMPTKQYSHILEQIYDNPNYYLSVLEANKLNLKSQSTYEKSKERTKSIVGVQKSSNTSNIDTVISYLLRECEDITPLALQKILYYIQGFSYVFLDKFIFEENCEAWVHGPVFRDIYFKYKEYRFDPINEIQIEDDFDLLISEKTIIDSVIKNLSCYSGKILESFTHNEMPWLTTRRDLKETEATDRIIDKQLISKYFIDVKEKNNMINPCDIGIYSKKMFEQVINKTISQGYNILIK